jgi:nicotinate-nucleotide adenylyltransferase
VAELARRRLRLQQVWLLVSPGNVLKSPYGMGDFRDRLASARVIADGRRIVATGIEAALGTWYSIDTLRRLQRIFPLVEFVWVMGADILEQLPRWGRWHEFARLVPFVVLPRPSYTYRALAGTAVHYLRDARLPARAATILAPAKPPAWIFLPSSQHSASASAIRAKKGAVL